MSFDAEAGELGAVQSRGKVIADFADVAGAESPGLASDHGGGDLASGEDVGRAEFNLGAGGGELVNGNECVGGFEADTDDVDFGDDGHLAGPNVKELAGDAKRNAHSQDWLRHRLVEAGGAMEGQAANEKKSQRGGSQD